MRCYISAWISRTVLREFELRWYFAILTGQQWKFIIMLFAKRYAFAMQRKRFFFEISPIYHIKQLDNAKISEQLLFGPIFSQFVLGIVQKGKRWQHLVMTFLAFFIATIKSQNRIIAIVSVLWYVRQMYPFWGFWNFCFQFVSFGCFGFWGVPIISALQLESRLSRRILWWSFVQNHSLARSSLVVLWR